MYRKSETQKPVQCNRSVLNRTTPSQYYIQTPSTQTGNLPVR